MTPIIPTTNVAELSYGPEYDRIFAALCAEVDTSNALEAELKNLRAEIRCLSDNIRNDTGHWHGDEPDDHLGNIAGYIGELEAELDNRKASK